MAPMLHVLRDAILTPTELDWQSRTYTGGVYDDEGRLCRAALRNASLVVWKPCDPEEIHPSIKVERVSDRVLYVGHYSGHYGHFLLETLSRFWALPMVRFDSLVAHSFLHEAPPATQFQPALVSIRSHGSHPGRLRVVRSALRIAELLVPDSLMTLNGHAHPQQAEVYRRIAAYCTRWRPRRAAGLRLYVSRSHLVGGQSEVRSITNEHEVEALFRGSGFTVIHPQRLRFADQVRLYERAAVLAGLSGSAVHNSVFMRPGTRTITLGTLRDGDTLPANQRICDGLAGVRSGYIPFSGRVVDAETRSGEIDLQALDAAVVAQMQDATGSQPGGAAVG